MLLKHNLSYRSDNEYIYMFPKSIEIYFLQTEKQILFYLPYENTCSETNNLLALRPYAT